MNISSAYICKNEFVMKNSCTISITDRGYAPLGFVPFDEAVIHALKGKGKCFIHYYILGGTIETEEWDDIKGEITGANL